MHIFLLLTTLFLGPSRLLANPGKTDRCFSEHLRDAIALNTERRPLYAAGSGGKSERLSGLLVASERVALIAAVALEALEGPLREGGIYILCEDLVPMSLTPAFTTGMRPLDQNGYDPAVTKPVHQDLLEAWHVGGYPQLRRTSEDWLRDIGSASPYHCMVRHLLESIARAAALAPEQVERAALSGKRALATSVIDAFLYAQIKFILLGYTFDNLAAPIQAEGLPIICGDVPPISVPSGLP